MDDFDSEVIEEYINLDELKISAQQKTKPAKLLERNKLATEKIIAARKRTGYKSIFYTELNHYLELYAAETIELDPANGISIGTFMRESCQINKQFCYIVDKLASEFDHTDKVMFMRQVKHHIEHAFSDWYEFRELREIFKTNNPSLNDIIIHFLESTKTTELGKNKLATPEDLIEYLENCDIPMVLLFAQNDELRIIESCLDFYRIDAKQD